MNHSHTPISHAGKSTLLQVLGGRSTARVTGTMHFNGRPMRKDIKRKLGFVTQDDMLYAEVNACAWMHARWSVGL